MKRNNSVVFNSCGVENHLINIYPGGEWLYYNIYVNQNSADKLIVEIAKKLEDLKGKDYSNSFFFVRYYEKEKGDHLRVRIRITPEVLGTVIEDLYHFFRNNKAVRSINLDTYQRELTRYGWPSIITVEEIFCIDSQIVSAFLSNDNQQTDIDKMKFCIASIYHYLNLFKYTEDEKVRFVENAKLNFFSEFNVDGTSKKSINKGYNQHIKDEFSLENALNMNTQNPLYIKRSILCSEIIALDIADHKDDLSWSIIHMFINKVFSKKYRLYEMIAYDYLDKILKTRFHTGK